MDIVNRNSSAQNILNTLDLSRINTTEQKLRNTADQLRNKNNLQEATQSFEALLLEQMFKAMRKTIDKKNALLYGGLREDTFEDMLYSEYAKNISQNDGIGIASLIYDQFSAHE